MSISSYMELRVATREGDRERKVIHTVHSPLHLRHACKPGLDHCPTPHKHVSGTMTVMTLDMVKCFSHSQSSRAGQYKAGQEVLEYYIQPPSQKSLVELA